MSDASSDLGLPCVQVSGCFCVCELSGEVLCEAGVIDVRRDKINRRDELRECRDCVRQL